MAPIPSSTLMYYLFAIVVGGGLSVLGALGLGMLYDVVQRSEDLRKLVGTVPVISIPHYRDASNGAPISMTAPASTPAASYRVLRNVLQTDQIDETPICIAVVSSRPGEGKTTTIANLGVVLANAGRNVIIVDANLRNPVLDHLFGLDGHLGFSDLMLGDCLLEDAIQQTAHPNLRVLGAGTVPPNYADVLSAGRINVVLRAVSLNADVVLVDTPGIQEEQEALLLAKQADAVLIVVESGRIRFNEVTRTLENLQRSGASVVSVALNKVRAGRFSLDRLPWSRESRLRGRAERRRAARARRTPRGSAESEHAASLAD
jgi:capsular exopolysaccharide synthesis family protein